MGVVRLEFDRWTVLWTKSLWGLFAPTFLLTLWTAKYTFFFFLVIHILISLLSIISLISMLCVQVYKLHPQSLAPSLSAPLSYFFVSLIRKSLDTGNLTRFQTPSTEAADLGPWLLSRRPEPLKATRQKEGNWINSLSLSHPRQNEKFTGGGEVSCVNDAICNNFIGTYKQRWKNSLHCR